MKELEIGTYSIPTDCRVTVLRGRIEVFKRKAKALGPTEYRCKDCKHRVKGHTSIKSYWETMVCDLKPKAIKNEKLVDHRLYYCAPQYGKPCDNFELRINVEKP